MDQHDLVRRLGLIRYLYQKGIEQSHAPSPQSSISVLAFHDCIEWFLITACEHFQLDTRKGAAINDYYEKLKTRLSGRILFNKVTSTREGLKHRLNIPSQETIDDCRRATTDFLNQNAQLLFNMTFDSVSLIDVVADANVRDKLRSAHHLMSRGEYDHSICAIASAYVDVRLQFSRYKLGNAYQYFSIDELDEQLFKRLSPAANRALSGNEEYIFGGNVIYPPSQKACQFCLDFVLETAVKIEQRIAGKTAAHNILLEETREAARKEMNDRRKERGLPPLAD